MVKKNDETNVEDIKRTLLDLKEQLGEVEQNYVNKLKIKAKEGEKKVEEKIEKNPIKSVGIALGIGAVLGAITYALLKKD